MSSASFGRRLAALGLDWVASTAVAVVITGSLWDPRTNQWNLPVFLAEVLLLTVLLGGSFGQVLLGMRIERLDGSRPSVLAVVIRTLLLGLVIPPALIGADGRGLHDRAAGTYVARFR